MKSDLIIDINLDVYWQVNVVSIPINASKASRKLPYGKYSDFRDYIRKIFDNTDKFKLLWYSPSDKAADDRIRLQNILPKNEVLIQDPYNPEIRKLIDNYLKIQPVSQSFYIAASPQCNNCDLGKWIIYVRISNHIDSVISKSSLETKHTFLGNHLNGGDMNYELVPVWFNVSYAAKQPYLSDEKMYNLEISDLSGSSDYESTNMDDVKKNVDEYIDNLLTNYLSSNDDFHGITGSSLISSSNYNTDLRNMIEDINNAIYDYNYALSQLPNYEFDGYQWKCKYIATDNVYVTNVCISDNFGGEYIVDCEIDIESYFYDKSYRSDTLQDLCIAFFEGYDWI